MKTMGLLASLLFLSFPVVAQSVQPGCGAAGDVCQDKLIAPPSLEPSRPMVQPQEPDSSALAPMLSPDNSALAKGRPAGQHALPKNHDNDLFASPAKKDALTDPFGPDSGQPLVGAPDQK